MDRNGIIIVSLTAALAVNSIALIKKNQKLRNARKAFEGMDQLVTLLTDKLDSEKVPMTETDRFNLDNII